MGISCYAVGGPLLHVAHEDVLNSNPNDLLEQGGFYDSNGRRLGSPLPDATA